MRVIPRPRKLRSAGQPQELMVSLEVLARTSEEQNYNNALLVTATSFMRNPRDHQMSDTIDTVDLPFLCGVMGGLAEGRGRL